MNIEILGSLSPLLSAASAIVAVTILLISNKKNLEKVEEHEQGSRIDLKEAVNKLENVSKSLAVLTGEQALINKFTADILKSLSDKLEAQQKQINELAAVTSFISEILKKQKILS